MVFSEAEIEVLRLCAVSRDFAFSGVETIPVDIADILLGLGLVKCRSKCNSYMISPKGLKILNESGFDYIPDRHYRTDKVIISRRICAFKILSFLWCYGINVFSQKPYAEIEPVYLSASDVRRKGASNVLGGTCMFGFLYTENISFIPYFVTKSICNIYPETEERIFSGELLTLGRNPTVIYTGDGSLLEITTTVLNSKSSKPKADNFYTALSRFTCPIAIMPLSENGFRQIRILSEPNYKEIFSKYVFGKEYRSSDFLYADAVNIKTGDKLVIGFDFNIHRFFRGITEKRKPTHILLLDFQVDAAREILSGRNVILHGISIEKAESVLRIPHEVHEISYKAFVTEKGENIIVQDFKKAKRNRG